MAIKDKLKGASRKPTYVPLYNLELYTITEYLPDHGCYRGKPVFSTTASLAKTLYAVSGSNAIGMYTESSYKGSQPPKNFQQAPQIQKIYEPQTVVLVAIPPVREGQSQNTDLGFILGDVPANALVQFDEAPEKVSQPQTSHTLSMNPLYQQVQAINQTSSKYYCSGKLPDSVTAGDYIIAGNKTAISIDNYEVVITAGDTRTSYSGVTGMLTEQAFLKNSKTSVEAQESYLVGTDVLTVSKQSYNIYDSHFNCYDIKEGQLVRNDKTPVYRSYVFKGEIVNGERALLYSHADKAADQKPMMHEHRSLDGTLVIEAGKGIHLRKTLELPNIICPDARIHSKSQTTFKVVEPEKSENNVKSVATNEASKLPDDQAVDFAITKDKKAKLFKGTASLDVNEDGSICLKDAWGSYILLAEGNIQIHAANNLFIVPGRDCINIAGGVHSIKAAKDIQLDAADGDVLVNAENNIKVNSNFVSVTAKDTCGIQGSKVLMKGTYIKVDGETEGACSIQIGNKNCTLTMASQQLVLWGTSKAALATEYGCISVEGNTVKVCGSMYVGGSLTMGVCKASITIDGETKNIDSSAGSLSITDGSLLVGGMIRSYGTLVVKQVVAETVAAKESSNGKMYKVRHVPLEPTKNALERVKNSKEVTLSTKSPENWTDIWDSLTFSFNKSSQACCYILKDEKELQSAVLKAESINIKGDTSYIYPGEVFWVSSGLRTDKVEEDGTISRTLTGFSNYRFNKNNVTEKGEK